MSLMRQFKPATEKPEPISQPAEAPPKPRSGAKPGPKPVDDPTAVMTFRLKKSVAARLKPGWRKRVAEFLEP